ncbi:MAG: glycosyltransferase, partial [Anaerolineae bacterium]|nr:glycosyltransferase [Anaerolineae bacterium]
VSLGLVGLYLAREMDIPVAASYQTDLPGFVQRWGMGFLGEPLWNFLRWVHDQADLNFCPSQFTLRQLASRGFRNLRVWGRGVDTERFHPCRADSGWRARLSNGHPEAPLLITVGRLSPEKRMGMLRPLLDALPGVRLAVVGDGPERRILEEQFAGVPVVFTGYLRGADLAAAYASADLFVLTSANETFGNVVLEAMASGLPVVVPHTGGQMDYVHDGVHGLVYSAEDGASLIAQVARLIENPALARELGAAGRAYAETQTWERVLDRLLADWATLLPPARPTEPLCPGLLNAREVAWPSSPFAQG